MSIICIFSKNTRNETVYSIYWPRRYRKFVDAPNFGCQDITIRTFAIRTIASSREFYLQCKFNESMPTGMRFDLLRCRNFDIKNQTLYRKDIASYGYRFYSRINNISRHIDRNCTVQWFLLHGILSLFMGISILSFVEIIYFATLRLSCKLHKRKVAKNRLRAQQNGIDCIASQTCGKWYGFCSRRKILK